MNDCYLMVVKMCEKCNGLGELQKNEWADQRYGFSCCKCEGKGWVFSQFISVADTLQAFGHEINGNKFSGNFFSISNISTELKKIGNLTSQ